MRERGAHTGLPERRTPERLRASAADGGRERTPFLLVVAIVVGYGLFYGVSTTSYLSAFASVDETFLFVPDIFFNVVVAVAVVLTAGAIVVLALAGRLRAFSLPYWVPTGLLVAVNVVVALGLFSAVPAGVQLLVSGLAYGVGSVVLRLAWIELMAAQRPQAAIYQLALGILVGAMLAAVMPGLELRAQAAVSCALLLVAGFCFRYARKTVLVLGERPGFPVPEAIGRRSGTYKEAFLNLGDAIVAFWILEAVVGLLNSFMLAEGAFFPGAGSVAMIARIAALIVVCLFAFAVQRLPKISTFSRVVMPVLAAMLVLLPFLSEGYSLVFNTMLLGAYYFIAMLISYLVIEAAYEYRVSVYVLMGVAMMGTRLCLAIALVAGYSIGSMPTSVFGDSDDAFYFLIVVVVVVYILSMAAILLSRGRHRRNEDRRWFGEKVGEEAPSDVVSAEGGDSRSRRTEFDGALEARCSALSVRMCLTEREGEIVVLLARGRTKAHIAKTLYVTENTVRSHVRNIYAKLGVHTRQELIDLIEQENPASDSG